MIVTKEHISFKILAFILAIAIVTPTLVKFSHGFQNHEHEVCFGKSTAHLHQLDIDCEFYKFKISTQYIGFQKGLTTIPSDLISSTIKSQYYYISDYQKLSFSLRGPPSLM